MKEKVFVINLLTFIAFPSESHQGHNHDTSRQKELIRNVITQSTALAPELFRPSHSLAFPYITPGRQRIGWDNAGSDLLRNLARLYRHKLHDSCPFAIDESVFTQTVPYHVAKGIISSHIKPLIESGATKITGIGSEYGETAAVAKGVSEIAETVISLSTPLKGIHILCTASDIVIIAAVRKVQIYGRVFKNSPMLEQNRFAALARLAWIRRKMIQGLKEVLIQLESNKIDDEALEEVNREGRNNNRRRYIKHVSARAGILFHQIREIDSQLENKNLSPEERKKLTDKKDKLYRKIADIAAVARKDLFGSRYGLSGFTLHRKWKRTHVKGHTFPDKLTARHWLWPLQVQEVWNRSLDHSLVHQAAEEMKESLRPPLKEDDIRRGLAEEFYDSLPEHLRSLNREDHIQSIEYMMGDVERIFDPSLSVEKKHFLALHIDMLLTSLFNGFIQIINEETVKNLNVQGFFKRLWSIMRLSWKHYRFARYSHIYSDFLLTASLAKNESALMSYKYEAMENFLMFMKYLIELDHIAYSVKAAPAIFAALDESIHPIQASLVSKRKRTKFSFIPFKKPKPPLCRDLVREAK